jgi:hypothetical protein
MKNKNRKNCHTVLGGHFSSTPGTVGLAQPAHASRRCAQAPGTVTMRWPRARRRGRRGFSDDLGVALPAGTPRGSDDGVLTGDDRRWWSGENGLARRRSEAATNPMSGEGVDESCSWRGGTWEVRRGPKGADDEGAVELTKGG